MITLLQPSRPLATLAALLLAGSSVDAASLRLNSTAHSNQGGVFSVTDYGTLDVSHYHASAFYAATTDGNASGFGTFCLEYSEPFTPGQVFDYSLASFANGGGVAGQTSPGQDPISLGTAWLYSQFALGNLATTAAAGGLSFSYANTSDLRKLQKAFWFLEDEGQGAITNSYVQLTIGQFGSLASSQVAANGAYGVSVLNLTKNGQLKQSQLYFSGLPREVPDTAATGLLLVGALAGLAASRRLTARNRA